MQGGMGGGYDGFDASGQYFMQPGMQGVLGQVKSPHAYTVRVCV
jgi:hypothetical protein